MSPTLRTMNPRMRGFLPKKKSPVDDFIILQEITPPLGVRVLTPYRFTLRSRSAFVMTDTELKLIAAAAIMGLSRMPKNG